MLTNHFVNKYQRIPSIVNKFLECNTIMTSKRIIMNIEDALNSPQLDSIGAKIWHIVDKFFPMGKFTSSTILEKYEDEYNEPIKLSIISTYLSRFTEKGKIERARTGREWTYQSIKISQKRPT